MKRWRRSHHCFCYATPRPSKQARILSPIACPGGPKNSGERQPPPGGKGRARPGWDDVGGTGGNSSSNLPFRTVYFPPRVTLMDLRLPQSRFLVEEILVTAISCLRG